MTANMGDGGMSVAEAEMAMHRRAQAGYADSLAQRPYAREYNAWTRDEQLAYESGRLWASNLMAANMTPLSWMSGPPPLRLQLAVNEAQRRIGGCFPGAPQPPSNAPMTLEPGSMPRVRRRRR